MSREYIERQPAWVATFRCKRNGRFVCLMKTLTGHSNWGDPNHRGLFPYGATGPFDASLLNDALMRRLQKPVACTSQLPQACV